MAIFKNTTLRFLKEHTYLWLVPLVLAVITLGTAYFVTMKNPPAKIGVTQPAKELLQLKKQPQKIKLVKVTNHKNYYQNLISGKYDAYVTKKNNHYQVITARKTALTKQLTAFLNHGTYTKKTNKPKHVFKILLSVLTMTTILLSLFLSKFYFDERNSLDKRIYLSGTSTFSYLIQHLLFITMVLVVTSIPLVAIFLPMFNLKLSIDLFLSIILIDILAAASGLLFSTLTASNQGALIIGIITVVITTLLSGSLFTAKKKTLQYSIQYLFPQHYFAELGKYLDGNTYLQWSTGIIVLYIGIFFTLAWLSQRRKTKA